MGSFSNTQYINTIDSLIESSESKLNNPFYKFSDKKPTKVNYYKQNITKSTLDCASQLQYAHVSKQSALRYNKIIDFVLYGLERITVDYDVTDNGTEAAPISGDAIIIPNTIEPLPGDFFSIPYLKEDVLFKVDGVTPDTLDNGNNIYKIEYHLELTNSISKIDEQVVSTFTFIVDNVGTEYNCLVSSGEYEFAETLESLADQLSTYYNSIFYNSRVQTYVYKYDGSWNFYDPYMIEFIRRNKILTTDNKYNYIAHQTTVSSTFPLEYSKSFFYALENKSADSIGTTNIVTANLITQINSLFTSRIEDYYEIKYMDKMPYKTHFSIYDNDLINAITNNIKYTDNRSIYNLIVSYFNGDEYYIDSSIINQINKFDFSDNKTNFYLIPIYIFIIRNYIKSNILSSSQTIN